MLHDYGPMRDKIAGFVQMLKLQMSGFWFSVCLLLAIPGVFIAASAVEYLRQAAVLNPKKAGVTRDIELLQRALKKSGQPADGDGADGKPEANSTETQTATPPAQPKAKRETKKPAAKNKPAAKKRTTTARQKAAS